MEKNTNFGAYTWSDEIIERKFHEYSYDTAKIIEESISSSFCTPSLFYAIKFFEIGTFELYLYLCHLENTDNKEIYRLQFLENLFNMKSEHILACCRELKEAGWIDYDDDYHSTHLIFAISYTIISKQKVWKEYYNLEKERMEKISHDSELELYNRKNCGNRHCSFCDIPPPRKPSPKKRKLLKYWGYKCAYCHEEHEDHTNLSIEHILPKSRGGSNKIDNLTIACTRCNSKKRTKTAAEFGFPKIEEKARQINDQ